MSRLPGCKITISKLEVGDRVVLLDAFKIHIAKRGVIVGDKQENSTQYEVRWDGMDRNEWVYENDIFYQIPEAKFRAGDRFTLVNRPHPKTWECGKWISEREICHERK